MALRRNSSQGKHGETRKEPRLFPERARSGGIDPADAPSHEPDAGPTTIDTETAKAEPVIKLSEFRSRIRSFVILAWLLPSGFSIFLLQYQGIYSASDMMLVLQRFGFAYIAICTLAASLFLTRYAERIARSVTDAPDPGSVDWPGVRNRLKWFQRALFGSFAAYCILGPLFANLVLGQARGRPFSTEEHILSLLAAAPGVIMVTIPIFFRLSDLIGAFFTARGGAFVFVSVCAKVAALGLLTPVMISTALFVYFRDRTGFISAEAIAVCATLVGAAGIGTWIAWSSFRRSLAPLRIEKGAATRLDDTTVRMTPNSLDEIGLLVRDWAQMTERDQTHYSRIRTREEQIRLITDSLPALIAYVDSAERFRFVNKRYSEWWQVEPDALIGKSLSEFLPPELYAKKTPRIAAALAGVETTDCTEFLYPDGKKRICEVRYVPHKCDTGAILGYFALISDITEQIAAERTAQKAHQRLLDAIESLPAGFSLYDEDERLVITNSVRRTLTAWHGDLLAPGVTFEALLRDSVTRSPIKGVDKDDAAAVEALVAKRLKDFRTADGNPIELHRNDGSAVVSLFHKTSDGGTVSISLDITEQKRAERAARLADQRLRDAIESMPAGFRIFDADERLVLWNSKYEEQSIWHGGHLEAGIKFEEILEKSVRLHDLVDTAKTDEAYINERVAEFRNPGRTPYEVRRSDGTTFLSIYRKTRDGGTVSVVLDVTEQKQAEKQAERERRRLLDSIDSLPIGFRLFDRDERLVHTNDRNHSQASWDGGDLEPGVTYEEILRRSVEKGFHVHDMESDEAYIACKLREFRNADGEPVEIRRSDGRTNLKLFRKTSDGETASIVLDITELKEAEKQVLENQQRLSDAIESLPVGFRLFDSQERLVLCNSVQKEMTDWHSDLLKPGVTYEEILRDSVRKGMYLHDFSDDEKYIAHRISEFRSEKQAPFELHFATGRHALTIFRKTADGGTVTIQTDVTDRIEAETRAKEASQRLLDAIESLPAGFCLFNKDERLVINNSRQREATPWHRSELRFGATYEDLVRHSVAERAYRGIDYDDPLAVEDFIANRLADFRNPQGAASELSRTDGTSGLSIFHKTTDGGTVTIMLDITERKQAEQALKASEGRLNAILDLAPEAIITTDEHYRIQMFNAGAERLFGFAAQDMAGRDVEILFAERERREFNNSSDRQGEPFIPAWQLDGRREMIALHKSGREIPVEISVSETMADGVRLHTVLLQDISERKRWEDDLRHAMQLADAANRAKSEFLSHMSHELRTPLNGILGYAEFIRDKWLGEDALEQYVEYAGFISESGQHLLQLINDILDLSKVEAGQYEAVFEDLDVEDLFKECQLVVAAEAEKSDIAIEFDVGPGASHWIADRRAVKQILINLLSNAMKFSEAGSRINVASSRDEAGHYRLKVQDTGIGMTEAEARRALEPFVQVGRAYVTQNKGTGLGLALVVRLAALHCGTVEIDSEPKQGTIVQVVFPPLPRDADAAGQPDQLSA